MAEVWMPGLTHDPGDLAGYSAGRNRMEVVKLHYTVGINSAYRGKQGYFQILVPRAGTPIQFAPVDAVNWDSSEWNDAGPGIEFEYFEPKDGPQPANIVTASQIEWGGKIARWFNSEHGIHLSFYDGARVGEFAGWRGFITHRSLIQTTKHSDYITLDQWNQMVNKPSINWAAIAAAVASRRRNPMWLIRDSRNGAVYVYDGTSARYLDQETYRIQVQLMAKLSIPSPIYDQQEYLIDRLAEQKVLVR